MHKDKLHDLLNHPAWRNLPQGSKTSLPDKKQKKIAPMLEADGAHAILCAKAGDWKPLLDLAAIHGFIAGYDRAPPAKNKEKSTALDAFKNFSESIQSGLPLLFQAIEATSDPRGATESLLACCPTDVTSDFCSLLLSYSEPSMFEQGPEAPIIELLVSKADLGKSAQTIFDNALACAETALVQTLNAYLMADRKLGFFSAEQKSSLLVEALRKERAFSSSDKMKCVDLLLDFGASLWDNPACQKLSLIEQAAEGDYSLNWNYICESKISPLQLGYAPGESGDLLCQRLAKKIDQAKTQAAAPKADDEDDLLIDQPSSAYLNIENISQEYPWHGVCIDWMLLRAQMRNTTTALKTNKPL